MTLGSRLKLSLCDPTQAPFLYQRQNSDRVIHIGTLTELLV